MRVLLIHPYITTDNPDTAVTTEPLGLLSLASYLKHALRKEIEVSILDLFALGYDQCEIKGRMYVKGLSRKDEILKNVDKFQPNIVGITNNFTAYAQDSFEVAKLIKEEFSNVVLVIGGAHATMEAEQILKNHTYIDYAVRGEGEITFYELVMSLKDNSGINNIRGISYRDGEREIITNPDRELIESLDVLPIIERKYINMEKYKKINSDALPFVRKKPVATIITSRGCPFNCIFCSTKIMWRRHWRALSPENVIKEIKYLVNEYGIREIAIQDDQFILDKKRINNICDLIIQNNLNISLSIPSGTSVWLTDFDLLKKMKKAGFYRLCFNIETGNQKTLKFIRKPVNLVKAKEAIKMTSKLGYWVQGNFIIGFPYETKEEIMETIRYAYNSGLDYVIFLLAKPYAGSEMYEIFKKEGLLHNIIRSSHIERSDYDTKTMKARELNKIYNSALRGFLIHKIAFYMKPNNFYNYLLPKLLTFQDIKYAIKIFIVVARTKVIPILKRTFNSAGARYL